MAVSWVERSSVCSRSPVPLVVVVVLLAEVVVITVVDPTPLVPPDPVVLLLPGIVCPTVGMNPLVIVLLTTVVVRTLLPLGIGMVVGMTPPPLLVGMMVLSLLLGPVVMNPLMLGMLATIAAMILPPGVVTLFLLVLLLPEVIVSPPGIPQPLLPVMRLESSSLRMVLISTAAHLLTTNLPHLFPSSWYQGE